MNTKRALLSLWVALSLMPAAVTAQHAAANVSFRLQATANGTTLNVSVGTTQTSVTDLNATFGSGSVGLVIHSSGGATPIHKADAFQATIQ
jgi:hypothetical protein